MSPSLSPGKIKLASSSQTAAPLTHGTAFRTINYKVSREIKTLISHLKTKTGSYEVNTLTSEKAMKHCNGLFKLLQIP